MSDNDFDRYVFIELPEPIAEVLTVFAEDRGWSMEQVCSNLVCEAVRDAFKPKEAR